MATNLFLSLELIYLLKWLIRHDKARLQMLINHALKSGLGRKLHELAHMPHAHSAPVDKTLNDTFLELLTFLENALHHGLEKHAHDGKTYEKIGRVLSQINVENVDPKILSQSINQATNELEQREVQADRRASRADTKRILMRSVLKNWKPTKDEPVN